MAAKSATTALTNSLVTDANRAVVQVGAKIQTSDATGTPQNSPLTVSSSVITLAVPDNAIQVTLMPLLADMRVSELVAMGNYDVIRMNTKEVMPCARMTSIYVKRDAAVDVSLQFKFIML